MSLLRSERGSGGPASSAAPARKEVPVAQRSRILVVDDDPASRELLRKVLATEGHAVVQAADGREALAELARQPADLVVSDIRMPDVDGVQLLDGCARRRRTSRSILVTAFGNVEGAVEAIRRGAFDYLSKPYDVDGIRLLVRRALSQRRPGGREPRAAPAGPGQVPAGGRSSAAARRCSRSSRPRPGWRRATPPCSSRARAGPARSWSRAPSTPRPGAPPARSWPSTAAPSPRACWSPSCSATRAAPSPARQASRRGLFEEADGGTLFLDEIGDVGPALQAQLLRALQEGEIRRVGGNEPVQVDVRVVAATNKDLAQAGEGGAASARTSTTGSNVVTIRLPPLRERREDIPLLAEHFAAKHGRARGGRHHLRGAASCSLAYDWPGNVRELENVIARALALNPSRPGRARGSPRDACGASPRASRPGLLGTPHAGRGGAPLRSPGAGRDRRQQDARRGDPGDRQEDAVQDPRGEGKPELVNELEPEPGFSWDERRGGAAAGGEREDAGPGGPRRRSDPGP